MMKVNLLSISLIWIISSCSTPTQNEHGWKLVYRNDASGNSEFGSKDQLIEAVRLGYDVRVGWGVQRTNPDRSVEHVVDANFLTIADEKEVFAQIQPIIGQAPRIGQDTLSISFRTGNNWLRIFGTNGFIESLSYDLVTDSVLSRSQGSQK